MVGVECALWSPKFAMNVRGLDVLGSCGGSSNGLGCLCSWSKSYCAWLLLVVLLLLWWRCLFACGCEVGCCFAFLDCLMRLCECARAALGYRVGCCCGFLSLIV